MKKQMMSCLVLLALVWSSVASAQENRAAPAARHSLWKVESRTNVVYLLGSVHILKRDDYPLAAAFESAYTNAQTLVFETDFEVLDKMETQLQMLAKSRLPAGETIKDHLSAPVYSNLVQHAKQLDVPMLMLERLKPAMAIITLEVMELMKLGVEPEHGIDRYYFSRARKDGKSIMGLETVDFQIGLVTEFTKEEGELLVKTGLEEIDTTRESYADMVAAWKTGDVPKLEKLLNEAVQESPAIFKRLVTDRNQRWIPKIEEFLRGNKRALVVVGAGHLVGKDGVVELLKKKGFKVTQL